MFGSRAIRRLLRERLQSQTTNSPPLSSLISKKDHAGVGSTTTKSFRALALFGAGVSGLSGLLSFATISSCDEAEHDLDSPNYSWPHAGILSSYDHASLTPPTPTTPRRRPQPTGGLTSSDRTEQIRTMSSSRNQSHASSLSGKENDCIGEDEGNEDEDED